MSDLLGKLGASEADSHLIGKVRYGIKRGYASLAVSTSLRNFGRRLAKVTVRDP